MRILQVGMNWFPQGGGGVDRYFHGLVTHLGSDGSLPRAFVFGRTELADARVRLLGPPDQPLVQRLRKVRAAVGAELAASRESTLIGTHFALYGLPLLDMLRRTPHVVHFHGPWADESAMEGEGALPVLGKRLVERAVYASGRRFVVLSEAFRGVLVDRYRIGAERISVVPGGVRASAFDTGVTRTEARERLGWPTDRPIVLAVRRLARRMGLENLIDAVVRIRARRPEILAVLVGTGPQSDELANRVRGRGLDTHIRLTGFIPDELLPFAYRAADLSVVPSVALEGFGLVVLESLAAGTPAVVTPVGGLPEVVQGLSRDLILEGAGPDELARGLSSWLDNPDRLPSSIACQRYAREGFDWPIIAARIRKVYESACR